MKNEKSAIFFFFASFSRNDNFIYGIPPTNQPGLPDFSLFKIPKREEIYQIST
jgi:hypothetical protein